MTEGAAIAEGFASVEAARITIGSSASEGELTSKFEMKDLGLMHYFFGQGEVYY